MASAVASFALSAPVDGYRVWPRARRCASAHGDLALASLMATASRARCPEVHLGGCAGRSRRFLLRAGDSINYSPEIVDFRLALASDTRKFFSCILWVSLSCFFVTIYCVLFLVLDFP